MENVINRRKKTPLKIAAWVLGGVILAVFFAFIFGYFVMMLWNWLMPFLFALPEITYLQAAGIIILTRLLFGGFGHHKHGKDSRHNKFKRKFNCGDDFNKDAEDWKYYHEYWKDEGEIAFKEYLRKKHEEKID